MNGKRMLAFILLVVLSLGAVGATSPMLANNLRLGLDLKGGFEILYEASPIDGGEKVDKSSLLETARSLEKRVNAQGIAEPEITTEGTNRIRVRIAGVTDEDKVREMLKKPADLTFRGPDGKVEMRGDDFVPGGASIQYDQTNRPMVQIKLKSAEKFGEITGRLVGQTLSIYLDERLLSSPRVNTVINSDTAVIEGSYTYPEVKELADTINLGALPLKLQEKYTQSVGASLGQKSLEETVYAGALASAIILLFMLVMYRMPGLVASIAIIVYIWLLLVVFWLMNATLTLPGIAAFVLGIGMAVDANIITYERIKEELRNGKSILSAVRSGSKSSFRTVMDANLTTIIAAAVLYFLGTGAIQGFALTLIFSILVSLFTNIFFSRILLQQLVRSNVIKKASYFGVKEADIRAL
ncbi:protein translocase subunit SecD [Gorillibacterium sp. sgz5001074]|uniref:protein translocase subunit SecD n=1 Tax=Gorillibacterium sp. sgz5001074 TaxID=3446695 RepID=UPI003F662B72